MAKKQSKLLTWAGILFLAGIFLMYTAYQSDQNYKQSYCAFPMIDSSGNAVYPEGCDNLSDIDTSHNWDSLFQRTIAGILLLISII